MSGKLESYRRVLSELDDWDQYLMQHSGLPGPRANLELLQAAADVASEAQLASWLKRDNAQISVNSPELFPVLCGLVGLGRLLAEGQTEALPTLRRYAADPRWRLREGVAMALQRWGDQDMAALLAAMERWSRRSRLEQRAAAAGLCEPRLLACPEEARRVLDILDRITTSVVTASDHKTEEFKILRQALGY